jgi:hypothetical protein
MSNVSSAHDVVPFVAGKTNPLTDQRLAKVGYKSTVKNPAKYPSIAVSVPMILDADIVDNTEQLLPYFRNMLEGIQDSVIRSLYESKEGELSVVTDSDISIKACIAFLESEAAGDRLKKEHIEAWFDRVCADNTYTLIAEKLGFTGDELTEAQDCVIKKHVKTYKDILSMLAGGRTNLTPVQIKSCKTVIELSEDDSGIGQKLLKKLEVMEAPKVTEFLEL